MTNTKASDVILILPKHVCGCESKASESPFSPPFLRLACSGEAPLDRSRVSSAACLAIATLEQIRKEKFAVQSTIC